MAGWVRLPVDDAVAAWTRRRRWFVLAVVLMVTLPVVGIVWAEAFWSAEEEQVHATARVTAVYEDGDSVALVWQAGEVFHEGFYTDPNSDNTYEVGDEIDIAYPVGHPQELHQPEGAALFVGAVVNALVFAGWAALTYGVRIHPITRQLALARRRDGARARLRFVSSGGRRALIWLPDGAHRADERTGAPTGAVRLGGRGQPLPDDLDDALVRGDVRPRGVVVVQVGEELLNTYGLVQRWTTDDD
jgi:hypothetical protein